jgi:hypothetical protein
MTITFDSKFVFVGFYGGFLHQVSIQHEKIVKEYGPVHNSDITAMAVTQDSAFLITGSRDRHIKKISVKSMEVVKDFGKICSTYIMGIQLTSLDKDLFVYDSMCN